MVVRSRPENGAAFNFTLGTFRVWAVEGTMRVFSFRHADLVLLTGNSFCWKAASRLFLVPVLAAGLPGTRPEP